MTVTTEFQPLKYRRTRIVATVGPASREPQRLAALLEAGVNVFRINMSHGTHAEHAAAISAIRELSERSRRHTAILADLSGPKIRTGRFPGGPIELTAGQPVVVTTREVDGADGLIPSQYRALAEDVQAGARILLNDGALELEVSAVAGTEIQCTVVRGGRLSDHKGINLPGVQVSAPSLTDKDRGDAAFALAQGVDFVALSFVRRAEDMLALRRLVQESGAQAALIAKIEKPEALANASDIIAACDGIMVARGDLGVELSPEQVPVAQHQLIRRAREANKPVIVATQMLESMIESPRPTRAEATDVANAVGQGADAVMLSGESAAGSYPVEAVAMMDRIVRHTEAFIWHAEHRFTVEAPAADDPEDFGAAIARTAASLVEQTGAHALVAISQSGTSAATISAARPAAPVIAISNDPAVCRRMQLLWGAIPVLAGAAGHDNPNDVARGVARDMQVGSSGQFIVLVRGFHAEPAMNTPTVTLLTL